MFIAANTRQLATDSSVFELRAHFEMVFLKILQVCGKHVFSDLVTNE